MRDLPWRKYQAVVHVEYYRVRCPQCGLKVEEVAQLPSKAPFRRTNSDRQCAGINRHTVGDERALQERNSETILASSFAVAIVR